MKWLNSACVGDSEAVSRGDMEATAASISSLFRDIQHWVRGWGGFVGGRITFAESTTAACDAVLMAIFEGAGPVVHTSGAHPTMRQSAEWLAHSHRRLGRCCTCKTVELAGLPTGSSLAFSEAFCARVEKIVQGGPGVLLLEHITYDHGLRLPIQGISERLSRTCPDLRILIDGSQAVGLWPPGDTKVAGYVGCFHKFTCGPPGSGMLWIADAWAPYLPSHLSAIAAEAPEVCLPTLDLAKWRRVLESLQGCGPEKQDEVLLRAAEFRENLQRGLVPFELTLGSGVAADLRSHISTLRFETVSVATEVEDALGRHGYAVQRFGPLLRLTAGRETQPGWGYEVGDLVRREVRARTPSAVAAGSL